MSARKDFVIYQGSKFEFRVTVWEDSVGGALSDLTGFEARMQCRETVSGATKMLDLTSNPAAGISINTATSVMTITVTATQTAAINTDLIYDLELLPTGNEAEAKRYLQGFLTLSKEVTK